MVSLWLWQWTVKAQQKGNSLSLSLQLVLLIHVPIPLLFRNYCSIINSVSHTLLCPHCQNFPYILKNQSSCIAVVFPNSWSISISPTVTITSQFPWIEDVWIVKIIVIEAWRELLVVHVMHSAKYPLYLCTMIPVVDNWLRDKRFHLLFNLIH